MQINTLQDRIIYLTGQITLIDKEDIAEIAKKVVVSSWRQQIEKHKQAISVLEENVNTSTSNLNLDSVSVCSDEQYDDLNKRLKSIEERFERFDNYSR